MSDLCDNIVIVYMHMIVINFWITNCDVTHMYSLYGNKIEDAGAQALAECLQYCTNLQKLK